MHRNDNRILTTHVGSLPHHACGELATPPALRDLLIRYERDESLDRAACQRHIEAAVRRVVAQQLEAGIDIGNNDEQSRVGFQT
jgi:5-methyltetrahydropteroyltriglutamate--homocysteine methyltransferase